MGRRTVGYCGTGWIYYNTFHRLNVGQSNGTCQTVGREMMEGYWPTHPEEAVGLRGSNGQKKISHPEGWRRSNLMVGYIVTFAVGALFGFVLMAIMVASGNNDRRE